MSRHHSISEALKAARAAADSNHAEIVRSDQLSRAQRELLLRSHWLQEIMRGWYILTHPGTFSGDSSQWFSSFWEFLSLYLSHRFGEEYCLSAESSLDIHTETPTIPSQVVVIAPKGGGKPVTLPFDTSVFVYSDPKNIPEDRQIRRGLQLMPLPLALCKVSPSYFKSHASDVCIALSLVKGPGELTQVILQHEQKTAAGRLIGAYRHLGNDLMADAIQKELRFAGIRFREENPFLAESTPFLHKTTSPYVARVHSLWQQGRESALGVLEIPSSQWSSSEYLDSIKAVYESDAYNSLSIEGFKVSSELIRRVSENGWNPEEISGDTDTKNALAARGYLEAHRKVEESVRKMLSGESAAEVLRHDLQDWYRGLFSPSVQAGILTPAQLAGYRRHPVYIRNSRHVPPSHEVVYECMEALFDCLEAEPDAGVRAVLGHYIFVFIHPYMDGNGRLGRFLMNLMLASGGYPWTVIRVSQRENYLRALASVDADRDFNSLASFISHEMLAQKNI